MKTKLRTYITGDYLYIDIDAVPVTNLDAVFSTKCQIGMAYDLDKPSDIVQHIDPDGTIYSEGNWTLPEKYFNSGVMLARDTPEVHDFFEAWHWTWKTYTESGLHIDQPSLNEVIQHSNIDIVELAPEWNACIGRTTKSRGLKHPKIYHYFTLRFDTRNDTQFINIVKDMKINQVINWDLVNKIIASKYPWTDKNSIRLHWMSCNYKMALKHFVNKFITKNKSVPL